MGSLSQRLERPTDRHQPTDQKAAIMWASPARLLSQVTVTLFLLLVFISDQPVSSSPQPGHLVHDFYKCSISSKCFSSSRAKEWLKAPRKDKCDQENSPTKIIEL